MTPEMFQESLIFGLQLTVIGLTVVFVALIGITIIVANFHRLESLVDRSKAKKAPVKKRQEPLVETTPVEPSPGELTPEVMAAITAAINETISKKARISRIRYRQ